tara:strand:- start:11 stop:199 length:189 start_codon:yes stop_codon:yes gene_type:complete
VVAVVEEELLQEDLLQHLEQVVDQVEVMDVMLLVQVLLILVVVVVEQDQVVHLNLQLTVVQA